MVDQYMIKRKLMNNKNIKFTKKIRKIINTQNNKAQQIYKLIDKR